VEPHKRNIEIVECWKTDDQRRRVRLREAPDYPLARADALIKGERRTSAEEALEVADELPSAAPEEQSLTLFG
jgi:hypothetical protein